MASIHTVTLLRAVAKHVQLPTDFLYTDKDQTNFGCPLWPSERQTLLLVWGPALSESCNSSDTSTCHASTVVLCTLVSAILLIYYGQLVYHKCAYQYSTSKFKKL